MSKERIGQVGLGTVGIHFARRLMKANGQLIVLDLDQDKARQAAQEGAEVASSPKDLAARSDIVLLSLPSPEAVEAVVMGSNGLLEGARAGTLVIDSSTIDPFTCRKVYDAAAARKVHYLDAPVSSGAPGQGGAEAAKAGSFTFLVGGDKVDFERAKPILEHLGNWFYHLGPPGSGSVMKLISNHISGINTLAIAEGLVLAAAAGFSAERTLEVCQRTVAQSYVMEDIVRPRVATRDFEPGFSVDLMHKDHRLAQDLGRRLNVPMLFNQVALEVWQMIRSQGRGHRDHTECLKFLAELARVDLYNPAERTRAEAPAG